MELINDSAVGGGGVGAGEGADAGDGAGVGETAAGDCAKRAGATVQESSLTMSKKGGLNINGLRA
jgi:hypothetical protein